MILNIDVTDKDFVVTRAPQPKYDQQGRARTDKATGKSLWGTQVVVTDESGGEVITINSSGPRPNVDVGDVVEVLHLVALPWASGGRSGVAYRVDDIKPVDD